MSDELFQTVFNGYFWLSLATIATGFAHLTYRYCQSSRCVRCSICNCLKIERNIDDDLTLNRHKSDATIL